MIWLIMQLCIISLNYLVYVSLHRIHTYTNSYLFLKKGIYWSWNGGARTVAYKDLKNLSGKPVGAGGSGMYMYIRMFMCTLVYIHMCVVYSIDIHVLNLSMYTYLTLSHIHIYAVF